jgi:hypothetical protein
MGRPKETPPLLDLATVRANFDLIDGKLVRRACRIGALNGEPATFAGPKGVLMVRLTHDGRIRRVVAAKCAWMLATGARPTGAVKTKNGADDLHLENLVIVPHCAHQPHAKGGRNTSLIRRRDADRTLLAALADHPHASIADLSRLTDRSEARTSAHLGKLAEKGLTASPMCVPGRSWALTERGLAVAMDERPLVDDLDCDVLATLARSPMRQLQLARVVGCCSLTAKRRLHALVERGLICPSARTGYVVTEEGRRALGDDAPTRREPWVKVEAVSAALSRDVRERSPNDDRTSWERSRHSSGAAAKAAVTVKLRKREAFHTFGDLDRMAG